MAEGPDDDRPRTRALAYLAAHHVATLSTCGPQGPWAAAVFYVSDGFELFFLSSPKTRHCMNLSADPAVAVTIQEDYSDWPDIKGIQLEGSAHRLSGEDEQRARRLYGLKYPVVGNLARAPAAIAAALAKVCWYRVDPRRLYFVDNSLGFGQRSEINPTA